MASRKPFFRENFIDNLNVLSKSQIQFSQLKCVNKLFLKIQLLKNNFVKDL